MNKLPKIHSVFLLISILALLVSGCYSSKSGNKRASASRSQQHYRPKNGYAKSGNKRSNSRSSTVAKRNTGKAAPKAESTEDYFDFDESTAERVGSGSRKSASVQAMTVIKAARSYTGTPYRYGGTTRKGMDCSGLLCTAFQSADIQLPRTSNEQASYGKSVSLRNLEPGDLVFFSGKKGSNKITHVGMVTEVRGRDNVMFIHSSTSRGVREDNLYSDYFKGVFVKAVRPF